MTFNWLLTLVVGTLVALLATAFGKKMLEVALSGWDRRRQNRATSKERDRQASERDAIGQAEEMLRENLTIERVGRRFRRRDSIDDPGVLIEVVALASDVRQWRSKVLVAEQLKADGGSHRQGAPDRYTIDWKALVQPHDEQRRMTARVVEHSVERDDGWVMFELID